MTIFEIDLDDADQIAEFAERVNAELHDDVELGVALAKVMREWGPAA